MTTIQLLTKLDKLKISLKLENGEIRIRAPKGVFTNQLKNQLLLKKQEIIRLLQNESKTDEKIIIENTEEKEYYPLSPPQERLFILQQMDLNNVHYNMPQWIPVETHMDQKKLKAFFHQLIRRHESLRTSFHMMTRQPVQRINNQVDFEIEYLNITKKKPDASENLEEIMDRFVRPFDLTYAPLLRVSFIKTGQKRDILLLDLHHIISDGVSHDILKKEFISLLLGEELPGMRLQYKDFSQWQNSAKHQQAIKTRKEYWLKEFSDELPVLNLPTDFHRPPLQSFSGSTISFYLSQKDTTALLKINRTYDSTLFMTLLSVFNVLLYKLSSQEDIIVGTPTAGRKHVELQHVIGMFVNTLAIRNYPKAKKRFSTFLEEVKLKSLSCFDNQDYPFEDIVKNLSLNRDTSRNPIFDVMFALHNQTEYTAKTANYTHENIYKKGGISKFDMSLHCVRLGNYIYCNLEYCTRLFQLETIESFIGYFRRIISGIIKNPDVKLYELDILTTEEKDKLLYEFNVTSPHYPKDKTIHQLFKEQVERTPHHTALVANQEGSKSRRVVGKKKEDPFGKILNDFGGAHLSYRELNKKSHQLARVLNQERVTHNTIVGLMTERSIEMIIGILAILKAGGAYLPIDPDYPKDRINYMLADSGAKILLTSPLLSKKFEKLLMVNCQLLMVNEMPPGHRKLNIPPEKANSMNSLQLEPANLAYIIYTSGTTGRPKGVMVGHKNVVQLMVNDKFPFDFNQRDVWTLFHSFNFDFSVWEMYGALLYGGKLLIIPKMAARDSAAFLDILKTEQVTILNQTPSSFYYLSREEETHQQKGLYLKYVIFGGEALSPGKLKKWQQRYPAIKLINMFGITETTVHVTYKQVTKKETRSNTNIIGKPLPTLKVYLVDKELHLVPIGVPGELCVNGSGVSRGYINRPGLTAEKFINASIIDRQSPMTSRLYRSGDQARWLNNGELEYLGRIDSQVKIRGFRIETGEIESRLLEKEEINEAVVIAKEDAYGNKYLCAYMVTNDAAPFKKIPGIPGLRDYLSHTLPVYMIPSYFMEIDKIPLTPNGKIDRNALPAPLVSTGSKYVPPQDELEKKLVKIWIEILNINIQRDTAEKSSRDGHLSHKNISIDDNFFELGGHSLKATEMTAKVHKAFNVKLPLVEVFKTPTIRGLSRYIRGAAIDRYDSIKPVEKKEYYPLSSAQKRLYILQQMESNNIAYNMPQIIPLASSIDIDKNKLEAVFKVLIARHEGLRTSFATAGEMPIQKIREKVSFTVDNYEADELNATNIIKHFTQPFDLSTAPLLRVGLLALGSSGHLLFLDMHHIITDGTSQDLLRQEFMAAAAGKALQLLRLQYKDYSQWQNSRQQKSAIKNQEKYWLRLYEDDIPVLHLPTDYPRPPVQSFAGSSIGFKLSETQTRELKNLAKGNNITLFMTLLSLFNILLAKLSGQEDIVVGTPIAARRHADLEPIIGMFVNTLALRSTLPHGMTTLEFFQQVKEQTLQAFENQEYQFEDLVEQLSINRDAGRNPLFDIMFTFNHMNPGPDNTTSIDNLYTPSPPVVPAAEAQVAQEPQKNEENPDPDFIGISKFDLTLVAAETSAGLFFTFQYCTKLFKKETIEGFSNYLKRIVSAVTNEPGLKLWQIQLLAEQEKHRLLFDFNKTEVEYPLDKTIHALFEEQVDTAPDRIALVGRERGVWGLKSTVRVGASHPNNGYGQLPGETIFLTYKELNQKSNQLAQRLQLKGVKPDTIVGILTERSPEMIIGILSILKAGGAYLPIDPVYPEERIKYMLIDSNVKVVLTDPETKVKVEGDHGSLQALPLQFIHVGTDPVPIPAEPTSSLALASTLSATNLAYTIYTSGSTGKPKGVVIQHRGLSSLKTFHKENFKVNEKDHVLQFASSSFDASVWEIIMALLNSASLYVVGKEIIGDYDAIEDYLQKNQITIATLPPSYADYLNSNHLKALRLLITAGSAPSLALVDKWRKTVRYMNAYGPTETTICAAVWDANQENMENIKFSMVPIGRPIYNTYIYILDNRINIQPVGILGELCIAGVGLARGYLNRPELTAEKFIEFEVEAGAPPREQISKKHRFYRSYMSYIYKTGDLAKWLPDGNIEFLGRIDHQVKIRGYRIEPGEIQGELLKHPEVKEAVTLVLESEVGDKYLCAYIVPGKKISTVELREYLSKNLPGYMIPSYIMQIEKIPLTPNGKIDRKALPAPEVQTGESYIPPANEIEEKLTHIWSEVLQIEKNKISMDANFFTLGGHSLKATIMIAMLKDRFKLIVPLVEVFKDPTIKKISEYIKSTENEILTIKDENLVLLNKKSNKPNHLFFIHDGTGEVDGYTEFCNRLNSGFNCWGIRADRLKNYAPVNLTIEELAKKYINTIKKVQSQGPYFITGWSLGGIIAYEIIKQLEQANEEIRFLAIIDSAAPNPKALQNVNEFEFNLESELNWTQGYLLDSEINKKLKNTTGIDQVWLKVIDYLESNDLATGIIKKLKPEGMARSIPNYEKLTIREFIYYLNMIRTLSNAHNRYYHRGKSNVTAHFFAASQTKITIKNQWINYFEKPLTFHTVMGDHYSIFRAPAVIEFSKIFDAVIARCL